METLKPSSLTNEIESNNQEILEQVSSKQIKSTVASETTQTAIGSSDDISSSIECKSKLEFGSYIDLSRVVEIYCLRMCKIKCEKYLSLYENTQMDFFKRFNRDNRACIETCPLLCECS